MLQQLPKVTFVLGKGGVGRSTVAAALGLALSRRGERVLVYEWTIAEPIAPWFGLPPVGVEPAEIAPRLSVANYRLDAVLRNYFVDHLGMAIFYKRVIDGAAVRRLIEAAPGLSELLFLGQLWWLTTLAPTEADLNFDRIVVDMPATGHGGSLLDMPAMLETFGATGLLALEVGRVTKMMTDPAWTGAIVVALPEELSFEETVELVPRATADLKRPPLAVIVNRSVAGLVEVDGAPWLDALKLSAPSRRGLETVLAELRSRVRVEDELSQRLASQTAHGVIAVADQLAVAGPSTQREIVEAVSRSLAGGRP